MRVNSKTKAKSAGEKGQYNRSTSRPHQEEIQQIPLGRPLSRRTLKGDQWAGFFGELV